MGLIKPVHTCNYTLFLTIFPSVLPHSCLLTAPFNVMYSIASSSYLPVTELEFCCVCLPGWPWVHHPLLQASWVAGITDMALHQLGVFFFSLPLPPFLPFLLPPPSPSLLTSTSLSYLAPSFSPSPLSILFFLLEEAKSRPITQMRCNVQVKTEPSFFWLLC